MTMSTPPACYCGVFAIGLCSICQGPVCSTHSSRNNDRLSHIGECAAAAQREHDELVTQIELRQAQEREDREIRIAQLPVAALSDLGRILDGSLPANPEQRGSRLGDYTCAQVAQAACDVGMTQFDVLTRARTRFRKAQFTKGWSLGSRHESDYDTYSRSVSWALTVVGQVIETDSATSRSSSSFSLTLKHEPQERMPHRLISGLMVWWTVYGGKCRF